MTVWLDDYINHKRAISVIGLGYVGLPLLIELSKRYKVIGYDIDEKRIQSIYQLIDSNHEIQLSKSDLKNVSLSSDPSILQGAHCHFICVPTDIDGADNPDLELLYSATNSVGTYLKKDSTVIFESTVYPGCTEEECLPILESVSSLKHLQDFHIAYSPERIVPGDASKSLLGSVKVIAGDIEETSAKIRSLYNSFLPHPCYIASSIKVAEAAKIVENTQRDINISLMNELSIIFDKMGINTQEVLETASTKWNFHPYQPGLVGGHCISVDPFYLIHKAKLMGHQPQVIAAGRRVNEYIPTFIAKKTIQKLIENGKNPGESRILILGITFKENVSDFRNSKVLKLIRELRDYSTKVDIYDDHADKAALEEKHNITLIDKINDQYDCIILAVPHDSFQWVNDRFVASFSSKGVIIMDVKGVLREKLDLSKIDYWSL